MRLTEIWQKGHPTKNQVIQIFSNGLKGKATLLSDKNSVTIEMYFHDFIDTFTSEGTSNKVLNLMFKYDKEFQNLLNPKFKEIHSKLSRYFSLVYRTAIQNARALVPMGWILNTNFSMYSTDALQNKKIKLKIERDYNPESTKLDIYYHFTLSKFLPNILKTGLVTNSNRRVGFQGYRNRIYLFKDDPRLIDHHMLAALVLDSNMFFNIPDSALNTHVAILKVQVPSDIKTYVDPEYSTYGVYVEESIPAEHIQVEFNGKLKDALQT